jgi:SNF2 family DNA or RNA helicase
MILDEAQNIKNFKSQRWNTLLHFNTQRRLLLTGTPLQNSMMELWSLLHFLMPNVFDSMTEFKYWFSNPLTSMVEGDNVNRAIVARLHGVIRPFILRRLKKDVAKQLPSKIEHVVKTHLSRRQRYLYEDFMSRSTTRHKLSKGGYMGQMSVLMSLRKVCNHPDLFEERPIVSPFRMQGLHQHYPSLVQTASERLITNHSDYTNRTDPFLHASLLSHNLPNQCRHMDNGSSGVRLQQLFTPAAEVTANSAGLYAMQPHPPSSFCTTVSVFCCFVVLLFALPYL